MLGSILRCAVITLIVLGGMVGIIVGSLYGLMFVGLCFGVDPLDVGITKDGVNAFIATQRMGDRRLYVCVVNKNRRTVSADLTVGVVDRRQKHSIQKLHAMLMPLAGTRIYSDDPGKVFSQVVAVKVAR